MKFVLQAIMLLLITTFSPISVNAENSICKQAFQVTKKGDVKTLATLIHDKEEILKCRNSRKDTLLHVAVHKGYFDIVKLLVEKGENLNERRWDGDTPLHIAAYKGRDRIAEFLLTHGANPNLKNKHGYTPFDLSLGYGKFDTANVIFRYGGKSSKVKKFPDSFLYDAIDKGYIDFAKFLLTKIANENFRFSSIYVFKKYTFLGLATKKGYEDIVKIMLSPSIQRKKIGKYFQVDKKDKFGRTPLHIAAEYNRLTIAKLLITHGANINAQDYNGETPLHKAVYNQRIGIIKLLLDKGAKLDIPNRRGMTPLDIAFSIGCGETLKLIKPDSYEAVCIKTQKSQIAPLGISLGEPLKVTREKAVFLSPIYSKDIGLLIGYKILPIKKLPGKDWKYSILFTPNSKKVAIIMVKNFRCTDDVLQKLKNSIKKKYSISLKLKEEKNKQVSLGYIVSTQLYTGQKKDLIVNLERNQDYMGSLNPIKDVCELRLTTNDLLKRFNMEKKRIKEEERKKIEKKILKLRKKKREEIYDSL